MVMIPNGEAQHNKTILDDRSRRSVSRRSASGTQRQSLDG
jgi:hypothetical protein